jgi:dipeptidyl aminopeptidase/acylaminoacyl peptidase
VAIGIVRGAALAAAALALACAGRAQTSSIECPACPRQAAAKSQQEQSASEPKAADPLLLDGTPEVPAELAQRLDQYLNVRAASLLDIDDRGTALLVSTRFAETSQIHRVDVPGGARRQLTFLDEPARGARFSRDGTSVLYRSDRGGNEQYQLFALDLKSGHSKALSEQGGRVAAFVQAKKGTHAYYASNIRNGVDFDVWSVDLASGESRKVADGSGYTFPIDVSEDGKKLLLRRYRSIRDSELSVLDLATGQTVLLTDPKTPTANPAALFAKDGVTVYVTSDREGEFVKLYSTRPGSQEWKLLSGEVPWNVESMALSADGRSLAFAANEGGKSALYLRDLRRGRNTRVAAAPEGVLSGLQFAEAAPVLAFSVASPRSPGDAYTYDLRRRKLTRWTESELAGLSEAALVRPTLVEFVTFDGAKIPAWQYLPDGPGPHPVVIRIHGGPESQARPYYSALTQYLVKESKVAVLQPNVRGSAGYGKTYLSLDDGKRREDSVKDIGALLNWIEAQANLDSKRVAVTGGSYGGYMVLASLVHFGERIRAGIDSVGISNFVTFLTNTADYRRDLRRVEYGDESDPKMREFLTSISPLSQVDKIRSSLFVVQGLNDPRVPASEAEQIVKAVREQGQKVWYMLARDEGHGFKKRRNRDLLTQLSVLFLQDALRD